MAILHLLNIVVHASAGVAAMLIGFTILWKTKGTELHRKLGKMFFYLGLVVCAAATLGLVVFRFLPPFSVITLLVLYQLIGGWRAVQTKHQGPAKFDAVWTILAFLIGALLVPVALSQSADSLVITFSTFGALALILAYDSVRWIFPRKWYKFLWRYEHSYKLLSSLFGMLSAFVGNVVRIGQPWSQIIPSVLGVICICYFFYKLHADDKKILLDNP